jgi:azurin
MAPPRALRRYPDTGAGAAPSGFDPPARAYARARSMNRSNRAFAEPLHGMTWIKSSTCARGYSGGMSKRTEHVMIRNTLPLLVIGALAAGFHGGVAQAAECATTLEANDAMQFSAQTLEVPTSCSEFSVTLKHVGKLPRNAMGHNVVIGKTSDLAGINADGMTAGLENHYVKPGDTRVIAYSEVIGGGESTTFKVPVERLAAGESYGFICSFPGHATLMKGSVVRVD